jgi:hypothetical protein
VLLPHSDWALSEISPENSNYDDTPWIWMGQIKDEIRMILKLIVCQIAGIVWR